MTEDLTEERAHNVALSKKIMSRFDMDNWLDLLHDDLVLEFPYAYSLGMPGRIVGKETSVAYLASVMKHFPGLAFRNVSIEPMADPSTVLVQYEGGCTIASGARYEQVYITIQKFKDGKMILFREFWNPAAITEAFGNDLASVFA